MNNAVCFKKMGWLRMKIGKTMIPKYGVKKTDSNRYNSQTPASSQSDQPNQNRILNEDDYLPP